MEQKIILPPPQIEAIAIAVDWRYVEDYTELAQRPSSLPPFNFTLLPAELRIMIFDEVVLSALDAATASRTSIKNRPCAFLELHEVWLVAQETVKNVVALNLDCAAQVLDSLIRLHRASAGKQQAEGSGTAGHALDDAASDLLYSIRFQLCLAHGKEVLEMVKSGVLSWVCRRPRLGKDLYRLAPGPEDTAEAQEAWRKLYGDKTDSAKP